ncbi:MAG: DNA-processing protein DprA [Alistipes sp.]|jgi:DNA processing protein|nr:DNA-processing protein DprA [Alistipes sp.]
MNINDIALTLETGIGVKTAAMLIAEFGSADAIYDAIYDATATEIIRRTSIREPLAEQLTRKEAHHRAERELAYIKKHGLTAIASTDADYPPLVREMSDPPHVLYVNGDVAALRMRCVSMVGTRTLSTYGQTMCDKLVRQLADRVPDLCIVSGLAFGIDVHCHRAALRYGVPTVAVLANTLPGVTPAPHADIARDIVAHGGAIVSECHSASKQTGNFYLARNRIIAGLSEGTIVVEAPFESGALSTADFALGYDRTVMAVPGRGTDDMSKGTNALIKNQRAAMVCSGEDVIRALAWDLYVPEVGERPVTPAPGLSADALGLLGCVPGGDAVSVDALVEMTALGHPALAPLLLELEFAGKIQRLPGGSYTKI